LREFSCVTQSHPCVHSKYSLLLATAIVLASSVLLHAQSVTTPASVAPSDATDAESANAHRSPSAQKVSGVRWLIEVLIYR
jgi:hypothetical protein